MESLGINLKNKTGVPNGAIILIRFSTKIEIFSLSNKSLPIIAHLKFDLNAIPSSSLFETVSIEDSTSKLFFQILTNQMLLCMFLLKLLCKQSMDR